MNHSSRQLGPITATSLVALRNLSTWKLVHNGDLIYSIASFLVYGSDFDDMVLWLLLPPGVALNMPHTKYGMASSYKRGRVTIVIDIQMKMLTMAIWGSGFS